MSVEAVEIGDVIVDVISALAPLIAFFLIFQLLFIKFPRNQLIKLGWGIALTGLGMVLFLEGVYLGFLPLGSEIGRYFGSLLDNWVLVPLGFMMGFIATLAEPAVKVLCYQVEKSSSGFIKYRLLIYTLAFGVGTLVSLGFAKIIYEIDFIYIILPGYLLVIVLLFLSDLDFVAVAFDAGGVATGPMAVSFLMSMAVGVASVQQGGDPLVTGFGLIALIALAPIIFILSLGIIIKHKKKGI
ncbi:MAG: DUF1538 domain-containing protein [Methanomassiliicoccales archaeon]